MRAIFWWAVIPELFIAAFVISGLAHRPVYPPMLAQHESLAVPFKTKQACLAEKAAVVSAVNDAVVDRSGVPAYAWQYIERGTL
jgi:hypothetical protein